MMKYPRVTVGAVIVNDDGQMLLLKSPKWAGRYVLPAGHVEFGEQLIDALKREVKEETGLIIDRIRFLGVKELICSEEYYDANRHFICVNYACHAKKKDVVTNDEAETFMWVRPVDALRLDLDTISRTFIERYVQQ